MISADYGNAGSVLMGFSDFAMSGKMWSVLMVVFLIFPHEYFVELFFFLVRRHSQIARRDSSALIV